MSARDPKQLYANCATTKPNNLPRHALRPVVYLVAQAHHSEKAQIFSAPYKDTARACPEKASIVAVTISKVIVSKTVFPSCV
ncbi:hypothetical protein [Nitrospira sp. ND1]|uniref:hypothetical protein n=1 Tax=Nitrospira sp. ND1 TaxID=1658518 RepID=UPI00117BFD89|nr:hypothetical protein [Nitrospira sp. ND1]